MSSANARRPTALVTGASSGIGLELARLLAADGHDLVVVARSREALDRLAAELHAVHGTVVTVVSADLADPAAPEAVRAAVDGAGLAVDVLVNNAGFGTYGRFTDIPLEAQLGLLQVNVAALVHLTRLFVPAMVARGRGRVLHVASTAAFQPGPLMAVYYASKAFVLSFSEALANELAGSGVTVTALCPGPTRSGFQARASMESARLVSGTMPMMDSATVARIGYRGMRRGARVVVPGLVNRILVQSVRFAPRRLTTAIARAMQERKAVAPGREP